MSDDTELAGMYESVKLVDRTGKGGCEFRWDGRSFVFKPGKPDIIVSRAAAQYVLSSDQYKRVFVDGRRLNRFVVADGPDDLMALLEPEDKDVTPLQIDTGVASHVDDPRRDKVQVLQVTPDPEHRPRNQGGPRSGTFSGVERGREP